MTNVRSVAASGLCLVAAVCMQSWGGSLPWQLWIPTGLLGLGALLALHRASGSQILVRAILWSNLLLATFVSLMGKGGDSRDQVVAAVLGAATGLALLSLGRQGLDERDGTFVPVAFRATLLALLVMALADAQSLAFWGTVLVTEESPHRLTGVLSAVCAGGFIVGVAGLYRLRTWGLLVNSLAAVSLIALVTFAAFTEVPPLQILLGGSATLQLALAVPLYRALVRGARKTATLSRAGVWVGSITVELLILACVVPAIYRLIAG